MANRRIIDLPESGTITDGDYYHVSQSGIDKRVPHSTLVGVLLADLDDKIDVAETLANEATLASNAAISAKDVAVDSAGAAQDSETAAEMSEANASSSELNAADSELMSQKWAANPENVVVEGGLYSSRHYMSKATTAASIIQGVEQTVLTAQTDVQQNATNALNSENNSAASANSSANSAILATASQNKAKDWASKPKGQEVETGLYSALHYADSARLDAVATAADRTQTSQFANTSSQNANQTAADATATRGFRDETEVFRDEVQQAASSVTNAMYFAGPWDASTGAPPTPINSGAPFYKVTVAGTIGGVSYRVGDSLLWDDTGWLKINTTYSVGDGGLTEINFTSAMQAKLAGVDDGANNYVHPPTHSIAEVSGLQDQLNSNRLLALAGL